MTMNKEGSPTVAVPSKPYNPSGPAVAVGTNPGEKTSSSKSRRSSIRSPLWNMA